MGQTLAKRIRDKRETERVHDRRATDLLKAGQYAVQEVEDPYEPGAKITAIRQLRGDPLARLHSHRQIDDAQYFAGRALQRDWEVAERGARAIDPTREAVDGGRLAEPLSDKQAEARVRLVEVQATLGRRTYAVIHAFLIHRSTTEQIAVDRGRAGHRWANYYGKVIRDSLDELATVYKLSHRGSKWQPAVDGA